MADTTPTARVLYIVTRDPAKDAPLLFGTVPLQDDSCFLITDPTVPAGQLQGRNVCFLQTNDASNVPLSPYRGITSEELLKMMFEVERVIVV